MVWGGAAEQIFDELGTVAVVDAGSGIDMNLMAVVRLDNIRYTGDGLLSHFGGKTVVRYHEGLLKEFDTQKIMFGKVLAGADA